MRSFSSLFLWVFVLFFAFRFFFCVFFLCFRFFFLRLCFYASSFSEICVFAIWSMLFRSLKYAFSIYSKNENDVNLAVVNTLYTYIYIYIYIDIYNLALDKHYLTTYYVWVLIIAKNVWLKRLKQDVIISYFRSTSVELQDMWSLTEGGFEQIIASM